MFGVQILTGHQGEGHRSDARRRAQEQRGHEADEGLRLTIDVGQP